MKCPLCEGLDVIKRGFNYAKDHKVQKYKCLSCNKMFSSFDKLPKSHVSSEIISLCFDLYFKGLSYRVIQQQILEQFGIRVTHVTIYRWIQKYTEIMKKYVDSLNPQLSAVWQMDETIIDFKGKEIVIEKYNRVYGGKWCWVAIDTVTRFVLDMYMSNSNNLPEGMKFFERLKKSTNTRPNVIITDGLNSYIKCISSNYPEAKHLNLRKISLDPSTSFIERFNGTIKNRTKTMRGFCEFYPCQTTLTAFQIYYNFLRPHMALGGKTPAQAAGIEVEFPQRWTSLIRNAMLSS